MKIRLALLVLLFTSIANAQTQWVPVTGSGCVGGSTCNDRRLRVPIDDRPVLGIRFHAHDNVGQKADGRLRVKVDGTTVRDSIDIPRRGETFTIDVDELVGRTVVFEATSDDEVMIDRVEVLYARNSGRGIPRDRQPGGWRDSSDTQCIGGDECRKNGTRVTIALERAPVIAIRFRAHDNIGTRADGRVEVRIDDTVVASYVDVARNGKLHEFDVDRIAGSRLVIRTVTDDEVEIADVEVLYDRTRRRDRFNGGVPAETRHEGGCIGGDDCGGYRSQIRIRLRDYPVESIRFYARDDVGTRAQGKLRIQIDDRTLSSSLDIAREGKTYEIDGRGFTGEYLIITPADDDEVMLREVRVKYGEEQ
jgi:hypothetical protein